MSSRARILLAAATVLAPALAFGDAGLDREIGRALFERLWVPAPASTDAADGLGPLFNARACATCHSGAGGARFAAAPDGGISARGLVVRFGDAAGTPDPTYGRQLQDHAVNGLAAEGTLVAALAPDGSLEARPDLARGALRAGMRTSLRNAPPLFGIGDRERVDEAAILARADPEDRDGDGISGRPRMVETAEGPRVGRYGWKGESADLETQVADAFALDLGLSSAAAPHPYGDCTRAEPDCLAAPTGESGLFEGHEISAEIVTLVANYLRGLAAKKPAPDRGEGARLFAAAGCAACHVPDMADTGGGRVRIFTDFLLHDMGEHLDDGVGGPGVAPSEWRTPALVDLAPRGGRRRYLHDGRAGTLEAAIRAHAGEAARARAKFLALEARDRSALLRYLESL